MIAEFMGINFHQDDQVTEHQGTENKSHEAEQPQSHDHAEDSNERVYVPDFFHERDAGQVIHVTRHHQAVNHQSGSLPVQVLGVQEDHQGQPHQHGSYDREKSEDARQETPHAPVLQAEYPVPEHGRDALYQGNEGNADGIGADHVHGFPGEYTDIFITQRYEGMQRFLHRSAIHEHEKKHE